MGFPNVAALADSMETDGAQWLSFFHKTGSPALPSAGRSADLSMAAGTPKYNAYVGTQAEGTPFVGAGNFGIYVPGVAAGKADRKFNRMRPSMARILCLETRSAKAG